MNLLNSTLGNVAATCEEIYNNGRIVTPDEKLVYKDFLQMCFLAYGEIASIQYYNELRAGNASFYFAQAIQVVTIKTEKKTDGRPLLIRLDDYSLLPYMAGILAVYPKTTSRDPDEDFMKMPPGSERVYGKPKVLDDLGLKIFVPKGEYLELYGASCDEITVEYIPIGEESEVSKQIGWIIIKEVLKVVMPGKALPIDTHEDTDPNQATYKQRLDQPQSI